MFWRINLLGTAAEKEWNARHEDVGRAILCKNSNYFPVCTT